MPVPRDGLEAEVIVGPEVTSKTPAKYDNQHDGADGHVEAVEAGQHEEGGAIGPHRQGEVELMEGVVVLVGLTQHEEQPGAKEANKAYGDSYRQSIKDQMKGNEIQMQYAGKQTPSAFDPFKAIPQDPKGGNSPMSKITRPAKPKTGAAFNK